MGATARYASLPGMALRALQMVRLVDHQQVDPRLDRLLGQPPALDQGVEPHDRLAVDVERVETLAMVLDHVVQPLVVEQHEDLVVLAPQLAQPLESQRLGGHDERALGPAGVEEAVQDQARLDRLAEADLVRQQPAHGIAVAGALGGVELVGEELDAPAEERAEPAGLADALEAQAVQTVGEVLEAVELAPRQPLGGRDFRRQRPEVFEIHLAAVGEDAPALLARLDDRRSRPSGSSRARPPGVDGQRRQSVRAGREDQGLSRAPGTRPAALRPWTAVIRPVPSSA